MRVTGPAVRRRNHAWLQMRSLERRATRLARRQELEDDSSDDADSSGDESEDSIDGVDSSDDEFDAEPTQTLRLPLATQVARPPTASISAGFRAGRGAAPLPPPPKASGGVGVTLGAAEPAGEDDAGEVESDSESDGEESADESTAPPANTTPPPGGPPPPGVTSAASTSTVGPPPPPGVGDPNFGAAPVLSPTPSTISSDPNQTGSSSSGLDELVTTLTGSSPAASATAAPTLNVPVTGNTQAEAGQSVPPNSQANEREGGLSMSVESQNGLDSGAIAGIILGVMAFIGLLAAAALLWRKRRRDRGLPFFPAPFLRLRDDDSRPPSVSGPFPAKQSSHNLVKTNTQIMDDLMKAAYAANNGTNNMESAYAPAVPKVPPQLSAHQRDHDEAGAFMDEKAYVALAGPPTPGSPKKPVIKWLDEVRTPTQPNGPQMPPTPAMPPSERGSGGAMPSAGRVLQPPKPAYYGRETMTTETTNTSVRWYG